MEGADRLLLVVDGGGRQYDSQESWGFAASPPQNTSDRMRYRSQSAYHPLAGGVCLFGASIGRIDGTLRIGIRRINS